MSTPRHLRSRIRGAHLSAAAVALMAAVGLVGETRALEQPWRVPHDPTMARQRSDEYAWRMFVAINWPANPATGTADRRAALGADRPVVWETWRNANEVYLAHGEDPGAWQSMRPDRALSAERRFETGSLRDLPNARHIVDGAMVPLLDPIAAAHRLTEIRMNRDAFDYIRAREIYNLDGQLRVYRLGQDIVFPPGSLQVKAKWRPIEKDQRALYHTVEITLKDGSRKLYGLTALHVVSKDLPNWFWATFEHSANRSLRDGEGWQLRSVDRFACPDATGDCDRAPVGLTLEGTVWQHYRLRGTMTDFVDAERMPTTLANSELEAGFQQSASCMTCHWRSAIGVLGGSPIRLQIFDTRARAGPDANERRGFLGAPSPQWLDALGDAGPLRRLDYVWSLSKAEAKSLASREHPESAASGGSQ